MKTEKRISEQFKGFVDTSPLWKGKGAFGIEQFLLPSPPSISNKKLSQEIPGLSANYVLGKRMENFFSYIIQSSENYKMVAENLQISKEKITIGEIDFLILNKKGDELLHIEMVYKFYLYDPSFTNEAERWIGPNRRDSLLQKVKKLKDQQFPLLHHEETIVKLHSLGIKNDWVNQKVCFKASLFVPWGIQETSLPLINNSCISGYWVTLLQFNSKEFYDHQFFLPKKQDWPIYPQVNDDWSSFTIILKEVLELHKNEFSPLLWMKTAKGTFERFFLVWW